MRHTVTIRIELELDTDDPSVWLDDLAKKLLKSKKVLEVTELELDTPSGELVLGDLYK